MPQPPSPPLSLGSPEDGKATPTAPSPAPQAVIVELVLNFFQAEIDQMAQDAGFMVRKGLLHAGEDQLSRLTAFIRHAALAHTHQAVVKELGKDLAVVEDAKRVAVEVSRLKTAFESRHRELDLRETWMADRERKLEELMVKYVALLKAQGLLEEGDGEGKGS